MARAVSSISFQEYPQTYKAAKMLPALVPDIQDGRRPFSSRALNTPIKAVPRSPPPDNASPNFIGIPPHLLLIHHMKGSWDDDTAGWTNKLPKMKRWENGPGPSSQFSRGLQKGNDEQYPLY